MATNYSLAKAATSIRLHSNKTSYAMLGLRIKAIIRAQWKERLDNYKSKSKSNANSYIKTFPWHTSSKIRIPTCTIRSVAGAFFQLKLCYGYLKAYLNRVKRDEFLDDRCIRGGPETTEHLILSCKEYNPERKILLKGITSRLTINYLLYTTDGIRRTIEFIKTTKILLH